MGSSSRDYYGLEVVPVTEDYEQGYKDTMLNINKQIFNGADALINTMGRSIASNRAIFNDAYLNIMGYNPNETISYRVTDADAVLGWAIANVNPDITAVHDIGTQYPENTRFALQYMYDTYTDFDYYGSSATLPDGFKYRLTGVTNNGALFSLALLRDVVPTVDAYVATNYDNTYEVLGYGNLRTDILGGNYWSTTLTHTISTDPLITEEVLVEVPAVYKLEEFPNPWATLQNYVISTYTRTFEFSVSKAIVNVDDGAPPAPKALIVIATLSTIITGTGRFEVVSSYVVTEGENADSSHYEHAEAVIAAARADYQLEVDAYVVSQVNYFYFLYDTPTETYVPFLQDSAMPDSLTKLQSAGAFPILPLKRRGDMQGTTTNRKSVFGKVGLNGDEFDGVVSDKDVYSAYFIFGVELSDTSPSASKYLFEAINNLASKVVGSDVNDFGKENTYRATGMRVWFAGLDVVTNLGDVTSRLIPGSIGPLGTYNSTTENRVIYYEEWEEQGDSTFLVEKEEHYKVYYKRKQVSDIFYQEIEIKRGHTNYTVDGKNNGGEPPLIPIVKDAMNRIPFKDYMYLLIKSMRLVILTKVTVTTKWYRSGLFKFVMLIVAVVLTVYTQNPVWIKLVLITVSVASYLGLLRGTLGTIISIVMIAYGGYQAATNTAANGANTLNTLALASAVTSVASMANQIQLYGVDGKSGRMGAIAKEAEEASEELEEASKLAKEIEENTYSSVIMPQITHKYADTYYTMALGEIGYNYDILYDYSTVYSTSTVPDLM